MSVAVELRHISKRFPGVIANKDVSLKVETGTVHALVGENGAGKSTVMKILYGMQRPDSGEILVNGQTVNFKTPNDAIDAGIGMVHQHFMLADNFTVLENIILGSEPQHGGTIDFASARKKVVEMAEQYGLDIDPDVLVEELASGLCDSARQLDLNILRQRLTLGWQRYAQSHLDLFAILVGEVLGDVRHGSSLNSPCERRLADHLSNLRVLHRGHVGSNVRLVVLVQERLDRFSFENVLILLHGINRLHVFFDWHKLLSVFDTQHVQHTAVEFG